MEHLMQDHHEPTATSKPRELVTSFLLKNAKKDTYLKSPHAWTLPTKKETRGGGSGAFMKI